MLTLRDGTVLLYVRKGEPGPENMDACANYLFQNLSATGVFGFHNQSQTSFLLEPGFKLTAGNLESGLASEAVLTAVCGPEGDQKAVLTRLQPALRELLPELSLNRLHFVAGLPDIDQSKSVGKKIFEAYSLFNSLGVEKRRTQAKVEPEAVADCILIGEAKNVKDPADLLSYCFQTPDQCTLKFCFSTEELSRLIDEGKDFVYKAEVEREALERGIRLVVTDKFDDTFVYVVHSRAEQRSAENGDPVAGFVTGLLGKWLEANPAAMNEGSFLQKAGAAAVRWTKWVVRGALGIVKWIWDNPFWSTVAIWISRMLRMVLCVWLSGVEATGLKMVIDQLKEQWRDSPVVVLIINLTYALVSCSFDLTGALATLGVLGMVTGLIKCARTFLSSLGDVLWSLVDWLLEFVSYMIAWLFGALGMREKVQWVLRIFSCAQSPLSCLNWLWQGDPEFEQQMIVQKAIAGETFVLYQKVVFFGVMQLVPAAFLSKVLKMVADASSGGLFGAVLDKINALIVTISRGVVTGVPSVLDVILGLLKASQIHTVYVDFVAEMYYWVIDTFSCAIRTWLSVLGIVDQNPGACCFTSFVSEIQRSVDVRKAAEATQAEWQSKSAVEKLGHYAGAAAGSMWSGLKSLVPCDPSLKVELSRDPVGVVCGLPIRKYAWNPERARRLFDNPDLPESLFRPTRMDIDFYSVSALDVQREFPEAVMVESQVLLVDVTKLPRAVRLTLARVSGKEGVAPRGC